MKMSASKFRAVFFDLDDTLISFDSTSDMSWRQVCHDYCKDNPSIDPDILKNAIDETRFWFWDDEKRHRIGRNDLVEARRTIVKKAFKQLSLPDGEYRIVADSYSRVRLENLFMIHDAESLLRYFADTDIQLALITNGESVSQRFKINKFLLDKYPDLDLPVDWP